MVARQSKFGVGVRNASLTAPTTAGMRLRTRSQKSASLVTFGYFGSPFDLSQSRAYVDGPYLSRQMPRDVSVPS